MDTSEIKVVNNEAKKRFEAVVDGQTAFLNYQRFPDRFVLVHTEVPHALENHGIAAKLVMTALDYARESHLRAIPLCPYVTALIRRHPEYQDVLTPQDRQKVLSPEAAAAEAEQQHAEASELMAFYLIARLAKLTDHSDLTKLPAFQKGKELVESRASYMWEAFRNQAAIDDYLRLRLEGALTKQGESWEDLWAKFAPESLKKFPLPPGSL